eukprot:TRINITY_DN6270_c0_g1_i1.p1 TRINITY_DN6270_c0_g1~~TRINITY_DN6270_c0_g1_i1.p1  ORF type:complete len:486 (+),score=96.10 TRINITY_DN6270_c0_g1_i1:8-1465(+)
MSFAPLVPIGAGSNPAYRLRYSMYEVPPTEKITLEEFEKFAIDRLKTLKALDNFRMAGARGAQLVEKMRPVLTKYLPMPKWGVATPGEMEDAIRRDVVSHFALRLAYCKPTNNERNWFLTQERALLQVRLLSEPDALENYIRDNDLKFERIDAAAWAANESLFRQVLESYGVYKETCTQDSFYVVPFEQATDLVAHRKVLLRGGKAYVHKNDIIAIVLAKFRMHISEALIRAYRQMPAFNKDERIYPLLESFPKQYLGKDYAAASNKKGRHIDINDLDKLADSSMPLCMKNCHKSLRNNHHMKHMGRMQYGLFLKGIGVTLEDALEFWRSEFSQKFGNSVFEKKYAYNIKHNYGLEGKKTDYTPYACQKIIEMKAQPGDDHGCPFRHWDQGTLGQHMSTAGIAPSDQSHIFGSLRQGQYTEACKQYFFATHPGSLDYVQNHPNKYFNMSMRYRKIGVKSEPGQQPSEDLSQATPATTTDTQMTDV